MPAARNALHKAAPVVGIMLLALGLLALLARVVAVDLELFVLAALVFLCWAAWSRVRADLAPAPIPAAARTAQHAARRVQRRSSTLQMLLAFSLACLAAGSLARTGTGPPCRPSWC